MKKKIFICEDHSIIIDGLKLLFENHPDFALVGHTSHGDELMRWLALEKPDLLLLDLNLKETDGLTLLEKIRKKNTSLKVLILTMYQEDELIARARKLGANAFLPKNISNEELIQALHKVEIEPFFLPSRLRKKIEEHEIFRDRFIDKMKLTKREVEIIRNIVNGKSSLEIASLLNVSNHTVDTHRKNIFRKLKLSNMAELVHFAHENYLI